MLSTHDHVRYIWIGKWNSRFLDGDKDLLQALDRDGRVYLPPPQTLKKIAGGGGGGKGGERYSPSYPYQKLEADLYHY